MRTYRVACPRVKPGHRLATGQHRVGVTGGSIGPVGPAAPLHVTPRISCPFRVTYLVGHVSPPLPLTFSVRRSLGVTESGPPLSLSLSSRVPFSLIHVSPPLPLPFSVRFSLCLIEGRPSLSFPLGVTERLGLPPGLGHPFTPPALGGGIRRPCSTAPIMTRHGCLS